VTTYVPGARPLKKLDMSTVISPVASGVGLPRDDEAIADAVFGFAPVGEHLQQVTLRGVVIG